MSGNQLPISLVIIAKDEAENIERCIKSAPWVSEVVVVENGSTDDTVKIATKLGARVIHKDWLGFGPQKKFAAEKADFDWILSLDADEALSPQLAHEIQSKFSRLNPQYFYEFPRKSFHLGRWIKAGGWYPDYQPRLFNRKFSQWNEARVHERIEGPNKSRFTCDLLHFVFRDLAHQVETNNKYSSLQAVDHFQKKEKFSSFKLLTKPWVKFLECYVTKKGFLDGMAGFIIAVGAGYSVFLRWAKLWEIENMQKRFRRKSDYKKICKIRIKLKMLSLNNALSLFVLVSLILPFSIFASTPKYPFVNAFIGSITIQGKGVGSGPNKDEATQVTRDVHPRENAIFESKGGTLRFLFNETDLIEVFPQSKVEIPAIDWEKGTIEKIILHEGMVRIINASGVTRVLESPLFAEPIGRGNYVFEHSSETTRFTAYVLEGSLTFRGLGNEKSEPLLENESIFFQGIIEDEKIAYDILLKGKKIAKGNYGKKSKIEKEQISVFQKVTDDLNKLIEVKKKLDSKPRDPTLICFKPDAKFGQCAWACEGKNGIELNPKRKGKQTKKGCENSACVRMRCSANGSWVDKTPVSDTANKCSGSVKISNCDY